MKLKSLIHLTLVLGALSLMFSACDSADEPEYILADNSARINNRGGRSILNDTTFKLNDTCPNYILSNDTTIALYNDSLIVPYSDMLHTRARIDTSLLSGSSSAKYMCVLEFLGITLIYYSQYSNLFPPDFDDGVNIFFNISGFGDIRYDPLYRVISSSEKKKIVNISIDINTLYLGGWTKTDYIHAILTFNGSPDVVIDYITSLKD